MSGKEKIVAGKNAVENRIIEKRRIDDDMGGESADVGESDEERSDQSKKRDAFKDKRQIIRLLKRGKNADKKEQDRSIYKDSPHIKGPQIAKYQISHRSGRQAVDITAGKKLHD